MATFRIKSRPFLRNFAAAGVLLSVLTFVGCGSDEKPASVAPVKVPGPTQPLAPINPKELNTEILAKESLVGKVLATSLTVYFRSNDAAAIFECRLSGATAFSLCPLGDRFRFDVLQNQQAYGLSVRARSQNGEVDKTPDEISFTVDLQGGTQPYLTAERPANAAEMRQVIQQQLAGTETKLLLGPLYEMRAPSFMGVRNFSTTQTITSSVYAFSQILTGSSAAGIGTEGCTRDWEQVIDVANVGKFCEGTPTITQWGQAYQRSYPLNHVEMVGVFGGQVYERVLSAAYGPWPDGSEVAFDAATVCSGAAASGRGLVPNLSKSLAARSADVTWCSFGTKQKADWWQAVVTLSTGKGIDAPRLKIVYGISATRGIYSSEQLIRRIEEFLPTVVLALGQTATPKQ